MGNLFAPATSRPRKHYQPNGQCSSRPVTTSSHCLPPATYSCHSTCIASATTRLYYSRYTLQLHSAGMISQIALGSSLLVGDTTCRQHVPF